MYMDDIKLFVKKKKGFGESDINNNNIQDIGMEFGTEKYAMLVIKSGKR